MGKCERNRSDLGWVDEGVEPVDFIEDISEGDAFFLSDAGGVSPDEAHDVDTDFEGAIVVKRRLVGVLFNRQVALGKVTKGGKPIEVMGPRRVDVTQRLNEATGGVVFDKTTTAGQVHPNDLPERDLYKVVKDDDYDEVEVAGPQLSTVRKQKGGASRSHKLTGEGGDPSVELPKEGGWMLGKSPEELDESKGNGS